MIRKNLGKTQNRNKSGAQISILLQANNTTTQDTRSLNISPIIQSPIITPHMVHKIQNQTNNDSTTTTVNQSNNNNNNNNNNKTLGQRRRTITTVTPQCRPSKQLLYNTNINNKVEFSTLEASLAFNCKSNKARIQRNSRH